MIKISPSLLAADFSRLDREVPTVVAAGADLLHLDVMDGHFVPNISFGPMVIRAIRSLTSIPFDVHLMIDEPIRYVDEFIKAGSDIISFHVEATHRVRSTLDAIHAGGVKAALAIKPHTDPAVLNEYLDTVDMILVMTVEPGFGGQALVEESLNNVSVVKSMIRACRRPIALEVDGGIKSQNIADLAKRGADTFVAGSAIFGQKDYAWAIQQMRKACEE